MDIHAMTSHRNLTAQLAGSLTLGVLLTLQLSAQDRTPAVAGQFYPENKRELSAVISGLFSRALPSKGLKDVVAIIAPHAGYVFSGEVAASAIRQIDPLKSYQNVFLMGVSHHAAYEGAAVYLRGDYITPLGKVPVNRELSRQLLSNGSLFVEKYEADAREHSLEVQVPLLQHYLKKPFRIVPILLGAQDPETCRKIAAVLRPYCTPDNVFVVSTDFSHYPAYADASTVDHITAKAVESNLPEELLKTLADNERKGIPELATSMCGWAGVLTLLYMTQGSPDITPTLIQYRNSGDSPVGKKEQVVGYCAFAFSQKEHASSSALDTKSRKELLRIARSTIREYLTSGRTATIDATRVPKSLQTASGAFVTLNKSGDLRGCIGRFEATSPLYDVVQQMAIAAATQDPRFPPVRLSELDQIEIEISVLTPMRRIQSIDQIQLGKHGIYIRKGGHGGTFLPQVARETGWSKEEFLGHCARDKAGLSWDGWKDAELFVYEAIVFDEHHIDGRP
jgi:MEMO1 family protein